MCGSYVAVTLNTQLIRPLVLVLGFLTPLNCSAAEDQHALRSVHQFVAEYCLDCHAGEEPAGGLDWEAIEIPTSFGEASSLDTLADRLATWEKTIKRLRARQMPPADADRPDEAAYVAVLGRVEAALDELAKQQPSPGKTPAIRRLSRTEYKNAIRDLLAVEIDVEALLPADQESHGFDNVTVGDLSPTLLNRYITAAQQISRLAVGARPHGVGGVNFRIRPDQTQLEHVEGLPLGTRGGGLFQHTFAEAGVYEFQIRLTRDRDEYIEGLHGKHEIDLLIDRELIERFAVVAPKAGKQGYQRDDTKSDAHLITRTYVTAGPHSIGATFPRRSSSLSEIKRQPFDASFNRHRHPRPVPAIFEVAITGPLISEQTPTDRVNVGGDVTTPSRTRLFVARPDDPADRQQSRAAAEKVLQTLMRRAYRRPITDEDLQTPLQFFEQAWSAHGFDAGIEAALAAVLVSPNFLFRVETDPPQATDGEVYRVDDWQLASRLSFFLWSSLPDDELLDAAAAGKLHDANELRRQVTRMLRDERASSLSANFADQWLYLRNLESFSPDLRLFPDFDDNLRQAFRRETQLLFEFVLREDRSVLDLLRADFSFLNQRLARHYGIDGVLGSHFRRVPLDEASRRGGLLRQGSILAVSSYATRTSPTIRGNWVLENLLGTPAPPPPPNVPALAEKTTLVSQSIRERLAAHRENPACAACHDLMDPVGFAMENYDAVGRWRDFDGEQQVDPSGALPDGTQLDGAADLEQALLARPELFVGTMVEKLLTYALGRGIEPGDGPAIRKIVRQAAEEEYRLSALLIGVVESVPFQMRIVQ